MINKKIDPRTLILFCILSSSIVLLSQSLRIQLIVLACMFVFALVMHTKQANLLNVLYKMRHILFTILILQVLFRQGGQVYVSFYFVKVTELGIVYACSALIRYSVIIMGSLLLARISLNEFLDVFQYYRFPRELSLTITFCIQYLTTFTKQIKHISQIIRQRNLYQNKSLFQKVAILKEVTLPLLIKSMSEVQYKAIALELKGISLKTQQPRKLYFQPIDYAIMSIYTLVFALILLFLY